MDDAQKIYALEQKVFEQQMQIVRLEQQAEDAATAVVLAKGIVSASWASFIAVATSLIAIGVSFFKH